METITIKSYPATQILAAGDPVTLIQNGDVSTTIYLGDDRSVSVGNTATNVPLSPQSFVVLDGSKDVWGVVNTGFTAQVHKIPGGLSFFQSGISGESLIVNGTGLFMYSSAPAAGDLIGSIAFVDTVPGDTTQDQFGNTVVNGIGSYDTTGSQIWLFGNSVYFRNPTPANVSLGQVVSHNNDRIVIQSPTEAGNSLIATLCIHSDSVAPVCITSPMRLIKPGQSQSNVEEIWHSLGSITATGYTLAIGQYRMTNDGDFVQFDIQLTANAGGGTAGTYTFANNLASQYLPQRVQALPLAQSATLVAGASYPRVNVSAAGAVSITVGAYAAGTVLTCSAVMSLS